ncbi:lipopolysaccharide biosynthesis protein [Enterococcus timonensis]|uniref:lipopolysaccharide biosynthesis protein n=1 Tax=Enterococcus timonensis TaxID=1852364 RepID=UPI0008DB1817|nr:oligosaccharide flippase family protein [Enterococcus timonensis]
MFKKSLFTNLIFAFGAQGISLLLSVILSLVAPKLLGVEDFGYWQLFIFYSSYIAFFHFGLNDGVYLLTGGKTWKTIDKSEIKSEFLFGCSFELLIAIFIFFVSQFLNLSPERQFIVNQTLINFLLFSAANFIGYVFQAVNQTKIFSMSMIINRIVFLVFFPIMLVFDRVHFEIFIYVYNFAQLIMLIYCLFKAKDIFASPLLSLKATFVKSIRTISVGSKLMLSNIASMLILGFSRFLVDREWGIEVFSKFSFALTLVNFFLLFINQVSMVLFPALSSIGDQQKKKYYYLISDGLNILLPAMLIFYFPIKSILGVWLPAYETGLIYFGILLPLCTSNGKMQLLNTTFFKVFRKEKELLILNVLSVVLSIVFTLLFVYVFDSMDLLLYSLVLVTWLRNYSSERILGKFMKKNPSGALADAVLVIIYLLCISKFDSIIGASIFGLSYVIFLSFNIKKVKNLLNNIKGMKSIEKN